MTATSFPPEVLFAKHRLLAEIGPRGQEALCAARFLVRAEDPIAKEAAEQLARSGLREHDASDVAAPRTLACPDDLHPPSDPLLAVAFRALAGALLATEHVRAIVGTGGRPLAIPEALFEPPPPGGR
ncbi:MAG: hypothetical protein OHK0013_19240 [Sandaracinaceae bacterium]